MLPSLERRDRHFGVVGCWRGDAEDADGVVCQKRFERRRDPGGPDPCRGGLESVSVATAEHHLRPLGEEGGAVNHCSEVRPDDPDPYGHQRPAIVRTGFTSQLRPGSTRPSREANDDFFTWSIAASEGLVALAQKRRTPASTSYSHPFLGAQRGWPDCRGAGGAQYRSAPQVTLPPVPAADTTRASAQVWLDRGLQPVYS
jgi:hypothetical protein